MTIRPAAADGAAALVREGDIACVTLAAEGAGLRDGLVHLHAVLSGLLAPPPR